MKAMGMTFGDRQDNSYFAFFSPSRQYNITRFQRTYTWGEYQIQGIIRDVKYVLEHDESVAWPSILIQRSPARREDNPNITYYDVGDGQQRIISVSLGLLALSRIASERRYVEEFDEDLEYLHEFKPDLNDPKRREGVLGRVENNGRARSFHPVVNFFSEASNEAFRSIFNLDDEELEKKISSSVESNDDFAKLYKAFMTYYNEFRSYSYSNARLREVADVLLTRIHLTVVEYETSENMQRAFANMNSFGIQLTEPELIKAEFYGNFKRSNPDLAEDMAKYWTLELESTSWEGEFVKKSSFQKGKKDSPLEGFLQEYYHTVTNWKTYHKGSDNTPHWLRDSWAEVLKDDANHEKIWEDFKLAAKTFKNAKSKNVFVKNSADWWANYSFNVLTKVVHWPSILIKLRLDMKDDEFIASLNILMRYWMYLTFVTTNRKTNNMHDVLIYPTSRLMKTSKWRYQDIVSTLEEVKAPKLQWRDNWYIQNKISKAEYDDGMNTLVVELLIYICNQKHLEAGHIDGLYNTRTSVTGSRRSREHILPQTPRESLTEEDRIKYDSYVMRIGNSIILSTDENSVASNKSISSKVEIYRNSNFSPWGTLWNSMFLRRYSNSNKWDFEEISDHSKLMGEVIAQYLSPTTPYSEFKGLLEENEAGDIFRIKGEDPDAVFTLTKDGLLSTRPGVNFGSFADLKESMGELLGNKKLINLMKHDPENSKDGKMVTIRNGKVSEEIITGVISPTKIKVICDDFEKESNSMKSIYVDFIKHLLDQGDFKFREAFESIKFDVEITSNIPEDRKSLYTPITSMESLYTYILRDNMRNKLRMIAETLNFEIQIIEE